MEQFAALLTGLGWERDLYIMQVVLPVGISFFTFQGMSYLIDIYRRHTEPARLLDMVLLMSFFPHLVAGSDRAGIASHSAVPEAFPNSIAAWRPWASC